MEIEFENLSEADLIVDCIYKGGKTPNISAEPFHKLIPGCENSGGFRKKLRVCIYSFIYINGRIRMA